MRFQRAFFGFDLCRIAHAVRGLKSAEERLLFKRFVSHRSRGAWIEMVLPRIGWLINTCRIAHAVRGLKYHFLARELKLIKSHRSRGAWIEIHS